MEVNRKDVIKLVAQETELSQKAVTSVIDALTDLVVATMADEGTIRVMKGITLEGKKMSSVKRRNPATGEFFMAPEKVKPTCHFTASVKAKVNGEA